MRIVMALAAFLLTLGLMFVAVVFLMLSVIGPHSPPPSPIVESAVYVVSGIALIAAPILVARRAWRQGRAGSARAGHDP